MTLSTWYIKIPFHYAGRKTYKGKPTRKYIQYIRDNYDKLEYVPLLSEEVWEAAFSDRPYPIITFDRRSRPVWPDSERSIRVSCTPLVKSGLGE